MLVPSFIPGVMMVVMTVASAMQFPRYDDLGLDVGNTVNLALCAATCAGCAAVPRDGCCQAQRLACVGKAGFQPIQYTPLDTTCDTGNGQYVGPPAGACRTDANGHIVNSGAAAFCTNDCPDGYYLPDDGTNACLPVCYLSKTCDSTATATPTATT